MAGFASETVSGLILLCFVPLFLTVATVSILWQALKKIEPDAGIRSFLTFIVVIVPFVMFVCLGVAAIFHDKIVTWSGSPTALPLNPPSHAIIAGTAIYIGQTVWLGGAGVSSGYRYRALHARLHRPHAVEPIISASRQRYDRPNASGGAL